MTPPSLPPHSGIVSLLLVIGGVAFIAIWLAAAAVWASMSLMGGLMANDAGRVSSQLHATLLLLMLAGEALVAFAGVPAGLAFFWTHERSLLLWTSAALLFAGAALQIWAFWSFGSAAAR